MHVARSSLFPFSFLVTVTCRFTFMALFTIYAPHLKELMKK